MDEGVGAQEVNQLFCERKQVLVVEDEEGEVKMVVSEEVEAALGVEEWIEVERGEEAVLGEDKELLTFFCQLVILE